MRLLFRFAVMFALVLAIGDVAHADAGATSSADAWAPLFALLAVACGSVGAIVRTYTPTGGFWHGWTGHILLMLIGALLGSLGPMFQAGILTKVTLVSALCGGGSAFLAAWKTGFKQAGGAVAAALLPLLLLPMLASSGCAGFKAPSYAVLTTMAVGAGATAEQLPAICESQENAAVDSSLTRDEATAKAGAIQARCKTTLAIVKGAGEGLTSARDAIHDAPTGADLSAVMPWLRLAVKQYCDIAPLLASFPALKAKLPTIPGVC